MRVDLIWLPTSIIASENLNIQEPLGKIAKKWNLEVESRSQSHIKFRAKHQELSILQSSSSKFINDTKRPREQFLLLAFYKNKESEPTEIKLSTRDLCTKIFVLIHVFPISFYYLFKRNYFSPHREPLLLGYQELKVSPALSVQRGERRVAELPIKLTYNTGYMLQHWLCVDIQQFSIVQTPCQSKHNSCHSWRC